MSLKLDITLRRDAFSLKAAFEVPSGVTALFGRSGSGKTTILNAIAGLSTPTKGRISLNDRPLFDHDTALNLAPHRRRMGCVFQDARLFNHLNVQQNLLYGAGYAPKRASGPAFQDVVELLGLETLLPRAPHTLSGGEKQRVALGRALLSKPQMLLMDEPLSALDAPRKEQILPYLQRLNAQDFALPILYVSHAIEEVTQLAEHLVILEKGSVAAQGRIFDIMSDPAHLELFGTRQGGAILCAKVLRHNPDGISTLQLQDNQLELPNLNAPIGSMIRLHVLAQDIILARTRPKGLSSLNILPVRVCEIKPSGRSNVAVRVKTGDYDLLARITTRALSELQLQEGSPCFAIFKATSLGAASMMDPNG